MPADFTVCYVSDLGFLFPTLVSVTSLRRYVPADVADVYVFTIGLDPDLVRDVSAAVDHLSIRFIAIDPGALADVNLDKWGKTHVPLSTLGRFLIGDLLPSRVTRFVYIDGDTLLVGDPAPLLQFEPPAGRIAAAEDSISFCRGEYNHIGRETRTYFKGLGLKPRSGYFNAGVFAVGCRTWQDIATEAFKFFSEHTDKCLYHDQSALNAVCGDRRVRLSNRWNFQTRMKAWGAEADLAPRLLHFSQFPKPWMAAVAPWEDVYATYEDIGRTIAPTGLPVRRLTAAEIEEARPPRHSLKQEIRAALNYRILLRRLAFRRLQVGALL